MLYLHLNLLYNYYTISLFLGFLIAMFVINATTLIVIADQLVIKVLPKVNFRHREIYTNLQTFYINSLSQYV